MTSEKLKRFFVRIYEKAFDEDVFSSSAQVAFYFLFALFPLLLFLINIFGLVLGKSNDMRLELFGYLRQVMPASAFDLVSKTLDEVVKGSSGGKLTLGILITLYSASAGIDSLRIALNAVYKLKEEREWWKRKLMSLVLTLAFGVLIFVALGIIFYGSQFVNLILGRLGLPISSPILLKLLAFVIALGVLMLTFAMLYYYVPNHKEPRWQWITPGSIVTIALWYLLSKGFGLYLHYFDSYAKTYGSLGAMIILMLWLYLTALVILIGGTMNAVLDEFSRGKYKKTPADEAVPTEKTTDKNNAKQAEDTSPKNSLQQTENKKPLKEPAPSLALTQKSVDEKITQPATADAVPPVTENSIKHPAIARTGAAEDKSAEDKPFLTLIVGSAVGLLMGLMFSKKNRGK
ncbi:MAG: YihY/virulence factor BrkB family protein [Pyrinomonadaceae bacterium]